MPDPQVDRFVQFFERITGHILTEMPRRADVVVNLDNQRRVQPSSGPPMGAPI
jgi:D-glycerate 3-kinase